jgi:hypothetical protein
LILLTCSLTLAFASRERPSAATARSVDLFRRANAAEEVDVEAANEEEEEQDGVVRDVERRRVRC